MTALRKNNGLKRFALTIMVIAGFVLFQNIASAHVASAGDEPHEPDCAVCVVQSHQSDQIALAAPVTESDFVPALSPAAYSVFIRPVARTSLKTRAPQPRGPPPL